MEINTFLNGLTKLQIIIIALFTAVLIGVIDYYTGTEFSLAIFYLIPISLTSWYVDKKFGIYMSILCALLWLNADLSEIERYSNHAFPFWNALVRFGFFIIIVVLIGDIKKFNEQLEFIVSERTEDLHKEIAERKKAEHDLRESRDKLRQLAINIQNVREEENRMIARDVHDELGQALTALKIEIAWLAKKHAENESVVTGLKPSLNIIDDTIKTIRKISTKLRPRLLDELGLLSAIKYQLGELEQHSDMEIIHKLPEEELHLEQNVSVTLFRIFQEAITNISRHSKATKLQVEILRANGSLKMKIKDNGIGTTGDRLNNINSLGVFNMRERAMEIGADFKVKSAPGKGTEINLELNFND